MLGETYSWIVDTRVPPDVLRQLLEPYRPFRIEVAFTNGFSTAEFGDASAYATHEPLAKLHYFGAALEPVGKRVLDVGCHLGYYGHYFLAKGARAYCGVEYNRRLFDGANLIAALAAADHARMRFEHFDFADAASPGRVAGLGVYDIVLSLASVNNMLSLTLALDNLAATVAEDGRLVLEFLALDGDAATCEFRKQGLGPDSTLYWIPTEALVDDYLAKRGLAKEKTLLHWRNDQLLEPGQAKIMSLYRRVAS